MAGLNFSSTEQIDIEVAVGHIQEGLIALHAIACADYRVLPGKTLSTCVEQMSLEMQVKAQQILDILDGLDRSVESVEVVHG